MHTNNIDNGSRKWNNNISAGFFSQALKEELEDVSTVANFATVQIEGNRTVTRNIEYYNLACLSL